MSKNWTVKKLICALLRKVLVGGIWSAKTSKFSGGCAPEPPPQLTQRRGAPHHLACACLSQRARWRSTPPRSHPLSEHKLGKNHSNFSTGMLISRRTELNVQSGQEGLNTMPRGAIINARGAKLNIQREQTMPRGAKAQTQSPEGWEAKFNAQTGQT